MTLQELTNKVLIGIPITFVKSHYKNWIECENTWVPLLRKKGFTVVYLGANEHLQEDYKFQDLFLFSKGSDVTLPEDNPGGGYNFFYKALLYPIKYILEKTSYEYFCRIDSDCFVHPERFTNMLLDNFSRFKIDYMGSHMPFLPKWNFNVSQQEEIFNLKLPEEFFESGKYKFKVGYASGSAFVISRSMMQLILKDFYSETPTDTPEFHDDVYLGYLAHRYNCKLLHDTRILPTSPFKQFIVSAHPQAFPFIANPDSHLAVQHYVNGYMEKIQYMLNL